MKEYTGIKMKRKDWKMFVSNIFKENEKETREILLMKDEEFWPSNVSAGDLLETLREINSFSGITDLCEDGSVKIAGGLEEDNFVSLYFFFDDNTFECVAASYDDLINLAEIK